MRKLNQIVLTRVATVEEGVESKSTVLGLCFVYCSFQSSTQAWLLHKFKSFLSGLQQTQVLQPCDHFRSVFSLPSILFFRSEYVIILESIFKSKPKRCVQENEHEMKQFQVCRLFSRKCWVKEVHYQQLRINSSIDLGKWMRWSKHYQVSWS